MQKENKFIKFPKGYNSVDVFKVKQGIFIQFKKKQRLKNVKK